MSKSEYVLISLQLFRPREDKEDATKKNTEASPQLVLACQQVVDTLVESVLRIEQVSVVFHSRLYTEGRHWLSDTSC